MMNSATFSHNLRKLTSLPDEIFSELYAPLIRHLDDSLSERYEPESVYKSILTAQLYRRHKLQLKGIEPESLIYQSDMWTYAVFVASVRSYLGFFIDKEHAKQWIVTYVPMRAREWLDRTVIDAILLLCQGNSVVNVPIHKIVLQAQLKQNRNYALIAALDSIYSRSVQGTIRANKLGKIADTIYFKNDGYILTKSCFDKHTYMLFAALSESQLLEDLAESGIASSLVTIQYKRKPSDQTQALHIGMKSEIDDFDAIDFVTP